MAKTKKITLVGIGIWDDAHPKYSWDWHLGSSQVQLGSTLGMTHPKYSWDRYLGSSQTQLGSELGMALIL